MDFCLPGNTSNEGILERPTIKGKNYHYSNALLQKVTVFPTVLLLKYSLFQLVPIQLVVNKIPCHKTAITNTILVQTNYHED